jgi:hypothetical protein
MLYLLYIADLPITLDTTTYDIADDTVILLTHNNSIKASLEQSLSYIQKWLKKWRIKTNGTKSVHVTFTIRKETSTNKSEKNSSV